MKNRVIAVFLFLVFLAPGLSFGQESVPAAGGSASATTKVGEAVPPAPQMTRKQLEELRDELRGVTKGARSAANSASKDAGRAVILAGEIKAEMGAQTKALADLGTAVSNGNKLIVANNELGDKIMRRTEVISDNVTENGTTSKFIGWCLGLVLMIGFGVVITMLTRVLAGGDRTRQDVNYTARSLNEMANSLPGNIAEAVKQPDALTLDNLEVGGRKFLYKVPVVKRKYVSIEVLPVTTILRTRDVPRASFLNEDEVKESVIRTLTAFVNKTLDLNGNMSDLAQHLVIQSLLDSGELVETVQKP